MFEEETTKVLEFLQSDDPYSCSVGSCRNTDYSSGIPLSLDTDMGNVKLGKNLKKKDSFISSNICSENSRNSSVDLEDLVCRGLRE